MAAPLGEDQVEYYEHWADYCERFKQGVCRLVVGRFDLVRANIFNEYPESGGASTGSKLGNEGGTK